MSVRLASNSDEIRNKYFLNTSLQCYNYTILFGSKEKCINNDL